MPEGESASDKPGARWKAAFGPKTPARVEVGDTEKGGAGDRLKNRGWIDIHGVEACRIVEEECGAVVGPSETDAWNGQFDREAD